MSLNSLIHEGWYLGARTCSEDGASSLCYDSSLLSALITISYPPAILSVSTRVCVISLGGHSPRIVQKDSKVKAGLRIFLEKMGVEVLDKYEVAGCSGYTQCSQSSPKLTRPGCPVARRVC